MTESSTAPLWVGPHYDGPDLGQIKLLIVAREHPVDVGSSRFGRVGIGLTAERVADYVRGQLKHREFTDLARSALGYAAGRVDCERFWNAVALATPAGGAALSSEQLGEWIEMLQPKVVLLVGGLTWPLELHAEKVVVLHVEHPGVAGFSFRDHSQVLASLRAVPSR